MSDNPLAQSRPRPSQGKPDPMQQHAMIWAHMHQQPREALQQHVSLMDYALPILGQLSSDPNVSAKKVIKAVAGAVADQKLAPSQGVAMISQIPPDADKVQPWLRQMYETQLTATVHAKAALMKSMLPGGGAQPQPMPGASPQGAPPQMMPQQSAPQPQMMPNSLQAQGPMR